MDVSLTPDLDNFIDLPEDGPPRPIMRQNGKRRPDADVDHFRLLVEQAAIGLQQVSLAGIIIETNQALCNTLGYSPKELIGKPYIELLDPRYRAASLESHREVFSGVIPDYALEVE